MTDDTIFQFRTVPGDANQDGVVDPLEIGFIVSRIGLPVDNHPSADVNADGQIDSLDNGYALARFSLGIVSCP